MAIPEITLRRIKRWCDSFAPKEIWDQVKYEYAVINSYIVTIVEVRPPWNDEGKHTRFPIARLRYNQRRNERSLYWRDRNLKFHEYDIAPTQLVDEMLDYIKNSRDPVFFG